MNEGWLFAAIFAFELSPYYFCIFNETPLSLPAGLSDSFEYRWARENCTMHATDEWLINCQGSVKASDSSNKIPSLGFTTAKIAETSLSGSQTIFRTRITFDAGNIYSVTIPSA